MVDRDALAGSEGGEGGLLLETILHTRTQKGSCLALGTGESESVLREAVECGLRRIVKLFMIINTISS